MRKGEATSEMVGFPVAAIGFIVALAATMMVLGTVAADRAYCINPEAECSSLCKSPRNLDMPFDESGCSSEGAYDRYRHCLDVKLSPAEYTAWNCGADEDTGAEAIVRHKNSIATVIFGKYSVCWAASDEPWWAFPGKVKSCIIAMAQFFNP